MTQRFTVDDGVESIVGISGVVNGPLETIGIDEGIWSLDYVSITGFVLALGVSGQTVLDVVGEVVLGMRIVVSIYGGYFSYGDWSGIFGYWSSIGDWSWSVGYWGSDFSNRGSISQRSSNLSYWSSISYWTCSISWISWLGDDSSTSYSHYGGEDQELQENHFKNIISANLKS